MIRICINIHKYCDYLYWTIQKVVTILFFKTIHIVERKQNSLPYWTTSEHGRTLPIIPCNKIDAFFSHLLRYTHRHTNTFEVWNICLLFCFTKDLAEYRSIHGEHLTCSRAVVMCSWLHTHPREARITMVTEYIYVQPNTGVSTHLVQYGSLYTS